MRLRRLLGPAPAARVVTRYPGYLIEAGEEEVDLLRFRRLCREGGDAVRAAHWESAWAVLTEGQGLWRGEPLADVRSEVLRRDRRRTRGASAAGGGVADRRRAAAGRSRRADRELRSAGGPVSAAGAARGPLMLALVPGRPPAEALEAYRHAREVLAEELGTEPGAGLRELHQQILAADPALAAPESGGAGGECGGPAAVPRELPGSGGRVSPAESAELTALTGLLDRSAGQAPARS